ncbi:hypothetical protein [Novosphingobium soli]|uniref:Lipoprotein n=1 Tax=Novosphingobium soli TaxID=574956 RepID=A0ABV6CSM7_9SPHN
MTRTLPLVAVAAALALAGCSKEPDGSATSAAPTETEEVFQESPAPVEATETGEADAGAEAAAMSEIPDAIRGRWGLVPADCTSTRGDAKGLLEVSADQLKFYESVAKLGEIKEAGESRIRATFAYTGEGQSWTQDVVLDVADDGRTMTRRDYGKDALPGPLKYTRCG